MPCFELVDSEIALELGWVAMERLVVKEQQGDRPRFYRNLIAGGALTLGLWLGGVGLAAAQTVPLRRVEATQLEAAATLDEQLRRFGGDRPAMIRAIDHSLRYLSTPAAAEAYRAVAVPEFRRDRVQRSLRRFRQLLQSTRSAEELRTAVLREFSLYQSIGRDGQGTVDFTGYFEPTYAASRRPTAEFRYPVYRLPPDLDRWPKPHPTRAQLEGADGLQGGAGPLRGLEIAWLRDRLEAFLIQVQGSARLQLTDGTTLSIGYAGRTDYPYVSLGRELINDGKVAEAGLSLPVVLDYFRRNPAELDIYIPRNNRFVFFRETAGAPPIGSLNVPVTAERAIATDKTVFPPGALALIRTDIPQVNPAGQLTPRRVSRYVLDQDTGGAIRGPGRVDIYMGGGRLAGDRAGLINHPGQLYYLLLNE